MVIVGTRLRVSTDPRPPAAPSRPASAPPAAPGSPRRVAEPNPTRRAAQMRPAPGPGDVHWENLRLRWWERRVRGLLSASASGLVTLFFLAPVTAISSLATLERLAAFIPLLQVAWTDPLPPACAQRPPPPPPFLR